MSTVDFKKLNIVIEMCKIHLSKFDHYNLTIRLSNTEAVELSKHFSIECLREEDLDLPGSYVITPLQDI